MQKKQSRNLGIIVSYLVTVLGSIINFLMIPVYLKNCGFEGYGFFQYIYSIASFATILDFGVGNVLCRYITEYKESGNEIEKENVVCYGFFFVVLLALVVVAVAFFVFPNIELVFGKMMPEKISLAQTLLILLAAYFIIALFQHMLDGIMLAYEKYITIKALVLVRISLKVFLVFLFFSQGIGVETIALSDTVASFVLLIFSLLYIFVFLKVKLRLHSVNMPLLKEISKLSAAFCIQSVVVYANNSIDKYLIGRIATTVSVAIYTLGMQFYSFFGEIPDIIQRYFIPEATKLVMRTSNGREYGEFAVKPGRIQFILLGLIYGAFLLFGRHLIILWSGRESMQAWAIGIVLMTAVIVPFVEGICLTILIALNKRMFRSLVLAGVAIVNFIFSIPLIHIFGAFGAALGTFCSLIIGNCIIMNIYYHKVIGIDVILMLKNIFRGLLPALVVAVILSSPLALISKQGVLWLGLQSLIFLVVYSMSLWILGLNDYEKKWIMAKVNKIRKKVV